MDDQPVKEISLQEHTSS